MQVWLYTIRLITLLINGIAVMQLCVPFLRYYMQYNDYTLH